MPPRPPKVDAGESWMSKGRLEAFSDSVFAIILTVMVLEIRVPRGDDLPALRPEIPELLSYLLSFVFVGIYWNNHHHMLHAARHVNGWVMWANLHLLFWLSLAPVATTWLGEHPTSRWPACVYGILLALMAIAFRLLQRALVAADGSDSRLAAAVGTDAKGWISLALYICGTLLAFVGPWISEALYVLVAVLWFIPDPRIEKKARDA
jgi:uncharacterized membrane protein